MDKKDNKERRIKIGLRVTRANKRVINNRRYTTEYLRG